MRWTRKRSASRGKSWGKPAKRQRTGSAGSQKKKLVRRKKVRSSIPRSINFTFLQYATEWSYTAVGSPATLIHLTSPQGFGAPIFDTETQTVPSKVWIKSILWQCQIDALTATPQPLRYHIWLISPRQDMSQVVTNQNVLALSDIAGQVHVTNANNEQPLLNYKKFKIHHYCKGVVGTTSISAGQIVAGTAVPSLKERCKDHKKRIYPNLFLEKMTGLAWTTLDDKMVPFAKQVYCYFFIEVPSSVTNTSLQVTFRSRALVRAPI